MSCADFWPIPPKLGFWMEINPKSWHKGAQSAKYMPEEFLPYLVLVAWPFCMLSVLRLVDNNPLCQQTVVMN